MDFEEKVGKEIPNKRIYINDVVMRDGLQIECNFIPTQQKIEMINALSQTGLHKIEVTSFTSPKAIPALRDAEEVMMRINRTPSVKYVALVPNMRGAERALECKVDEINLVMSASDTHNLSNTRMTMKQSKAVLTDIIKAAKGKTAVNISISTAFGCPMEGYVDPNVVRELGDWFCSEGATGITICDTTGMANPIQVAKLSEGLVNRWPNLELTLHFHNTRGMGLANVIAGLMSGVNQYDASLGGLGGCPYAPSATGNICTEDLVHMLTAMGLTTGVDLNKLLLCARNLPSMVGHDVPGAILRAGKSDALFPPPIDFAEIKERALARAQ
jgi:hydroxymethylglutaryl-CoA lyase